MGAFLAAIACASFQSPPQTAITLDKLFSAEFAERGGQRLGEWLPDGKSTITIDRGAIVETDAVTGRKTTLASRKDLTPEGDQPLEPEHVSFSEDGKELLVFANSSRVWRQNTKGDYYVLDLASHKLHRLGGNAKPSSLMFAKLSPDHAKAGFVEGGNLYTEDLSSGKVTELTFDGSDRVSNGTFDWVYEEELDLRDGWRWSPDSSSIAFWQIDSTDEPTYTLIDDTDALYPTTKQFPYPKAGQKNGTARIGVVPANGGGVTWIDTIATSDNGYLSRMDWAANSNELIVQAENRLQNDDRFLIADAKTGKTHQIFGDKDAAYVELFQNDTSPTGVNWVDDGRSFLMISERDGWRHIYGVSRDGAKVADLTPGSFDIDRLLGVDPANGWIYYSASPSNAIQRYLYRSSFRGEPKPERVTPPSDSGVNEYEVSPDGSLAIHSVSSFGVPPTSDLIRLPDHSVVRALSDGRELASHLAKLPLGRSELIQLPAADGEKMDAFVIYPPNFDSQRKYPLFFTVYGEPAGTTVSDSWTGMDYLFNQMLAEQGYIVASVDNRGTPTLKGRAWRKSIYRKIGVIASDDQASAARQLCKLPYVDASRVGIWGWSGGGSMTLNMMFRYPDIYKVGMAVAPVPDMHLYDTIYQERYMGLPQTNEKDYTDGSPITYAGKLKGALLIVHGSGDDNVHYQGTERLVNKLVSLNKPFQLMVYPNRSHGIYEGEGTTRHLYELLVRFLNTNMPPGGR